MIEPIWVGPHDAWLHKPELEAKHIIFDCGNGYGLSVITAKGDRFESGHGMYVSGFGSYEAMIIENIERTNGKPKFKLIKHTDPKGWLTIGQVGELAEAIKEKGLEAW